MLRSLIAVIALLFTASTAFAQSCTGNPVAVQILGSGAPGFVRDRANTSYLLWVGNQAKILLDAGGGAYVRFGQAGAKFSDLSMILVSHLHPDHVFGFARRAVVGTHDAKRHAADHRAIGRRSGAELFRFSAASVRSWERVL